MQLAAPLRLRARAMVVIAMALALVFSTLSAPALAGDDLESARASALETVNYKINSLKEYREGAKTDRAWAIYSEGIEELGGIKARILEEDNVEEIYALKDRAKAVWAETKELAAAADAEHDDEGDKEDDEGRKEEEEKRRRREREQAEAAFAEAQSETLLLIEKKIRLMTAAFQSAGHPQMSDIYRRAANALTDLLGEAHEADSIDGLEAMAEEAWDIVHAAKKEIAAYRPGHDKDDDGEDDHGDHDEWWDKKRQRDRGDDEGTDGDDDEGTDGDDDSEEERTILAALSAMELEVDNYQIAIQITMSPETGIGVPEGFIALDAGGDLLNAIDAARSLTGDDLALAWADIMDLHSAYIQLVMAYDLAWSVGLFTNEVVPI